MKNEQRKAIWLAAYNAALSGLLAKGLTPEQARKNCNDAAASALEDFEKRWPQPPAGKLGTPRGVG